MSEVNLTIRCIPAVLTDNDGCGHVWTERRRVNDQIAKDGKFQDAAGLLLPFRTTPCPNCGRQVALAPAVGEPRSGACLVHAEDREE